MNSLKLRVNVMEPLPFNPSEPRQNQALDIAINQLRAMIVESLSMKDYHRATRTLLTLGTVEQEHINNPMGAFPYFELALEVAGRIENTNLIAEV